MTAEGKRGGEAIRAAGGLLWRRGPEGHEIAVLLRARYDDWTLPKGKLEPGETWKDAALREVREETGYQATPLGFAGAIAYETDNHLKVVRYWNMMAEDAQPTPPDTEVAKVVWMPIEEARRRLDYPLERAIVETWQAPEEQTP